MAFKYLTIYLSNLKPWMGTIAATKFSDFYREQFKMYLADPLSTQVFDQVFKKYPLIPVTLAICLKIKLMSIECDTPLFPNCDFSSDFPNGVGVKIAERFDTLSQEEIRRYNEKYYTPLSDDKPLKDDISRKLLPELLKQLNFVISISSNNLVKLDVPELARRLALVIIHESRIPLSYRTVTREELASMTIPLEFDNWSTEGITRILAPALLRHAVEEHQRLCATPIPGRNFISSTFVPEVFESVGVSGEPIDPTGLDYLLERGAPTHRNEPQGDDADVDPAEPNREALGELSNNGDIGENHDDMMDFALGDDDALGRPGEIFAGQTQEIHHLHPPERNTISGTPYARPNAEATDAQGTDSGINSPEPINPVTPTARKRGRNDTEIRIDETLTFKRNRGFSSNHSDGEWSANGDKLVALMIANLHSELNSRMDYLKVSLENIRAGLAQIRTKNSPLTKPSNNGVSGP